MKAYIKKAFVDALRSGEWKSKPMNYSDKAEAKHGCALCVLSGVSGLGVNRNQVGRLISDGEWLLHCDYSQAALGVDYYTLKDIEAAYNRFSGFNMYSPVKFLPGLPKFNPNAFVELADWVEDNISTDIEDDGTPPAPISAQALQGFMNKAAAELVTV